MQTTTEGYINEQFRWVCRNLFPTWDNTGWRASFGDIAPAIDGRACPEEKTIKVASRLPKGMVPRVIVHEVAHAATNTSDHSAAWRDAVMGASKAAATMGCANLARQLEVESQHPGITDTPEKFYEWEQSYARNKPDCVDFDPFLDAVAKAFRMDRNDLLRTFPLMRRKFNEVRALQR